MAELTERAAMSAPQMIFFIKKKFRVNLSAGTLYPAVKKLEKKGLIRKMARKRIGLYCITENGLRKLHDFQKNLASTEDTLTRLFKMDYWEFITRISKDFSKFQKESEAFC
jgi:DNA-binding PadR family transcriptional regulator